MMPKSLCYASMKQLPKFMATFATTTTIDESEISKFGKHGKQWWDASSEVNLLLSMNQLRVPFIRDGLINLGVVPAINIDTNKPLKGLKVLDIGCGGGYLSEALARIGAETTGVDGSQDLIAIANSHKEQDSEIKANLHYEQACIEDFSKKHAKSFDAVVASEVIEHVVKKDAFVQHCVACLKPGGSIFMTTINKTMLANLLAICVAENIMKIVPRGAHEYEKFIEVHELQRMLEYNSCYTRKIHGLTYNPLTRRWWWIPFTDVNYAIHAVKEKLQ